MEFTDLYSSKLHYDNLSFDKEMQRTAWFTSMILSSTGNYGKKGVDPKKLYKPVYDDQGNVIEENKEVFTPIAREEKNRKLAELISKFNTNNEVGKVE